MGLNITEIAETFDFNKDDLKDNRQLTNEILVDDIMLGLGYNKRRDKNVHRMFDSLVDWKVSTESGKQIAVKVLSYDEPLDNYKDMSETTQFCVNSMFSVLLVINGAIIRVMRYDKKEHVYNTVYDIELKGDDTTGERTALINAICKESFSIEFIDSKMKPEFTYENFLAIIAEKVTLIPEIGALSEEVITEYIDKLINSEKEENRTVQSAEDTTHLDNSTEILALNEEIERLKKEVDTLSQEKEDLNKKMLELENSLSSKITHKQEFEEELVKISEENSLLKQQLEDKEQEFKQQLESKEQELEELRASSKTEQNSENNSGETSEEIDSYVEQIKELAVKLSDAIEEKDKMEEELKKAREEIEELSGSDIRFAERLLESADDDPNDDRSYVAVINKELLNYEDIHTFIGRCLQKLYDIKSFDASRYLFDGDIFELDRNPKFSDLVMGNTTYDVILKTNNENEELNKLRAIFSHFEDIVFVCKKIGTLKKDINSRYGESVQEEVPQIKVESDSYIEDNTEFSEEEQQYLGSNTETQEQENTDLQGEQIDLEDDTSEFEDDTLDFEDNEQSEGQLEFEDTTEFEDNEQQDFNSQEINQFDDDALEMPTDDNSDFGDNESLQTQDGLNAQDTIPYFDEPVEIEDTMEKRLLVAQLLNIDMLVWTEEAVRFNNIKYISTNTVTFVVSQTAESYDKLLCKCIDAVLAIEAFNGSKDLISTLKQRDFSQVSNFIKVYSSEYSQYPRINGTKYVVVDIESIQQVAATLLDICTIMGIDTQEIFLYFEAETNSQYIIENFDFDENAIRLAETSYYVPEEGVVPNEAVSIIRGDMFNHIMITKNSLRVHKEVFLKAIAVRTKYLGVVIDTPEKIYEIIADIVSNGYKENINVDYRMIGNVIGENYLLVSEDVSKVKDEHVTMNVAGHEIHISKLEDWQAIHSIIKAHTAIFNNTSIAVKSSVNADAVNFYGQQFATSEPSLGLAVNSFVDYVASCVKE